MELEQIFAVLKKDPTIKSIFDLAMRRHDLWMIIRKNNWDKIFFPYFGTRTWQNGSPTFKSYAYQNWSIKQQLRYYYKYHYPLKSNFREDIFNSLTNKKNELSIKRICPITSYGRPSKLKPPLRKEETNLLLKNIDGVITIRKAIDFFKKLDRPISASNHRWSLTLAKDLRKKSLRDVMAYSRAQLISEIVSQGLKSNELTDSLKIALNEKMIILRDYSHIVLDRPKTIGYFPYRSYEETKLFAKSMKVKSSVEWQKLARAKSRPLDIPSDPDDYYKDEWTNWGDFLGKISVQNRNKKKDLFVDFEGMKEFVLSNNLRTKTDFEKYCKDNKRPCYIPSQPKVIYKDNWNGSWQYTFWKKERYLSFKEVKEFVQQNNLKSESAFYRLFRSGNRPKGVPSVPRNTYKEHWKGGWMRTFWLDEELPQVA